MSCQVLVLPVVGSDLLASFSDLQEELAAGLEPPVPWANLAGDLVRNSSQDSSAGSEVFLCFLGDQIPNRPATDLQDLLYSVRLHAWGSAMFLVTLWYLELQALRQNRAALLKWLESARTGRAADLLQVYDASSPVSLDPGKLQEACRQAAVRRTYLLHRAFHGQWSCRIRMERQGLARLLEGEAWMPLAPTPSNQLLVVVDRSESDIQMSLVEEAWDESPGRCLVATLQVDASDELIGFCRERGLEILAFSGVLELWYFFLRLNDDQFGFCQEVTLDRQTPVFHGPEPEPSILFTNAWNPDAESPEAVLQAAKDWDAILNGAPLTTRSLVDLAVTWERLFEQVDFLEGPLIWIYTGPRCEGEGLVDASGRQVSVETWLGCFADRGRRLPVAVFLCGGSAPVARRFASAGAQVAVGFESAELTCHARRLAIDMLHMAFQTSGSREAVLRTWNTGLTIGEMSRPRAYYSR